MERLYALPMVGDVRGGGYFYAVELVKDKATKRTLDAAEVERVLRGYIAGATFIGAPTQETVGRLRFYEIQRCNLPTVSSGLGRATHDAMG
jgi:adenosylmethionine-8-amino-7-oxononanoate aminotransferase